MPLKRQLVSNYRIPKIRALSREIFKPCSKFSNCILNPLVVWKEFFTLFALLLFPFRICLSCLKIFCCKCQTFFSKMWCSLTHCNDFPFLHFFSKTEWRVLPHCVTVWRKNQQINDLYWLTIFRKNWKIAFWSALCSAGC